MEDMEDTNNIPEPTDTSEIPYTTVAGETEINTPEIQVNMSGVFQSTTNMAGVPDMEGVSDTNAKGIHGNGGDRQDSTVALISQAAAESKQPLFDTVEDFNV